MKITGNAGNGNTFTEINIGHVENVNMDAKEVFSYHQRERLTLAQLIRALDEVQSRFTTADIPIKLMGRDNLRGLNVLVCQDKDGNYYIDIKEK